jgi:hypothetical protein
MALFCPTCEKDVQVIRNTVVDCSDCQGTGIGYPPPEAKCIYCKGRGYKIVEPYYTCSECEEVVEQAVNHNGTRQE